MVPPKTLFTANKVLQDRALHVLDFILISFITILSNLIGVEVDFNSFTGVLLCLFVSKGDAE